MDRVRTEAVTAQAGRTTRTRARMLTTLSQSFTALARHSLLAPPK